MFDEILCFGYYDGPTEGLGRSAKEGIDYWFQLVAWDADRENRIFALSETYSGVFDSAVQIISRMEDPHWPVWVPRWTFSSPREEKRISSELDAILGKVPSPTRVVMARHLEKEIQGCRELNTAARERLPARNAILDPKDWPFWNEYLRNENA